MIVSFKCKYTKQLFDGKHQERFSQAINKIGKRKLDMLNSAYNWEDLKIPPSNKLEFLQGNLKGFCSIRVNNQFRLIFRFENSNAYDVYIDDYHK